LFMATPDLGQDSTPQLLSQPFNNRHRNPILLKQS
jgi:hypothetical protein